MAKTTRPSLSGIIGHVGHYSHTGQEVSVFFYMTIYEKLNWSEEGLKLHLSFKDYTFLNDLK